MLQGWAFKIILNVAESAQQVTLLDKVVFAHYETRFLVLDVFIFVPKPSFFATGEVEVESAKPFAI